MRTGPSSLHCGSSGIDFLQWDGFRFPATDHGLTWFDTEEISGSSPTRCVFGNSFDPRSRSPNSCDFEPGLRDGNPARMETPRGHIHERQPHSPQYNGKQLAGGLPPIR